MSSSGSAQLDVVAIVTGPRAHPVNSRPHVFTHAHVESIHLDGEKVLTSRVFELFSHLRRVTKHVSVNIQNLKPSRRYLSDSLFQKLLPSEFGSISSYTGMSCVDTPSE